MFEAKKVFLIGRKKFIINPFCRFYKFKELILVSYSRKIIIKNKKLIQLFAKINKLKYQTKLPKSLSRLVSFFKKLGIIIPYHSTISLPEIIEIHDILKLTQRPGVPFINQRVIKNALKKAHSLIKPRICQLDKNFFFLYKRKSIRNFNSSKSIKLTAINKMLNVAYGIIRIDNYQISHRTTPSAGAFYPVIIMYFDFKRCTLFYYTGYKLKPIRKFNKQAIKFLFEKCGLNSIRNIDFQNAQGLIFIFLDISKIIVKYGFRGYYFGLLEAGHVLQGLNISSIKYNIGICEIGLPLNDALIKKALMIKNKSWLYIISCVIGPL